ncbi:helix-turn-helix domain-containing protein [Virgibacillus sp. 179-BFC.A HS]|uniref:Helix-turn-helix domain-containing protein n=1 Tax=Tigheibacillus jepli TaxID=3035914 RepID=A0ABU5CE97_9BACI|nr:helix-turn-helix domain-containing protein [Virgibacillus sp. 179-BFC.A HS]MDY0404596.1 helix-turn-helix domain-containing protein [Virgibacillus sp. 179-BFC.A HS]
MNKRHSWEKRIEQLQNEKNMTPKQAKILQAAIELFARKGYFNTSTNEIAKLAGVAEGTIFRHYQTKKELLEAILAPAIMDFTATFFVDQFIADAIHTSHKNMREFLRHLPATDLNLPDKIRPPCAFYCKNWHSIRICRKQLSSCL